MKFRSRHLLILLGTLGAFCSSSQFATATEVQTTKVTVAAEANTPSPTVAPSASEAPSPASASPPQTAPSTPVEASPATPPDIDDAPPPRAQNFNPDDSPDTPVASKPKVPAPRRDSPPPIAPTEPSQPSASSEPYASDTSVAESSPAEAPIVIAQAPPADEPRPATKADQKQELKKLDSGKLGQLTFVCGTEKGEPATIAKLNDRNIGVILWNSTLFTAKGFDPKTRCQQVSARFQEYNKAKNLVYLTTGNINGQSVICITTKKDGGCGDVSPYEGLLFTLKPSSNAQDTLKQLSNVLAVKDGTSTKPLEE